MTHDINLWSLGISGLTGLATGGLYSFKNVLTSGVGKPIFKSMITNGVDILVGTIGTVAAEYLNSEEGKPYDFWKSLAGGLIGAGLEKIIPLKFVDKFEAKLMRKMNVSINKAARIKAKIPNFTRSRTIKKWEAKLAKTGRDVMNYTSAWSGVKTVNDTYKKFGASSLNNELYLKDDTKTQKAGTLIIGEITSKL